VVFMGFTTRAGVEGCCGILADKVLCIAGCGVCGFWHWFTNRTMIVR